MNSDNVFMNSVMLSLVWNPLKLSVEKVPDDCQDEFLDLKADPGSRDMFNDNHRILDFAIPTQKWQKVIYTLLPFVFASTYCESGFSTK